MKLCRQHAAPDLLYSGAEEDGNFAAPISPLSFAGKRRGIALIITLIMLSVITFMTVTFLVLSQRERGAVTTTTDQSTARLAADAALERAKVELLGPMLANHNYQLSGMLVSTNFINPYGYDPTAVDYRTNVNFEVKADGSPLTTAEFQAALKNQLLNPRPPVFMTNRLGVNEWSYYLDLNRNGIPDSNGYLPVLDAAGLPITTTVNGNTETNYSWFKGDPEWIGVLEFPDQPFGPDNPFVARYAYAMIPISKALDVNAIFNQSATRALTSPDGFMRNQGVGTWEINLPAFWADLNRNIWTTNNYQYFRATTANGNVGSTFDDSRSILAYRYNFNYNSLASVSNLFAAPGRTLLAADGIDQYSDGPLNSTLPAADQDNINAPWPGADNPNHFYTPQDFFDRKKFPGGLGLVDRLYRATTNSLSSYDRYTFYRLMEQLGTESNPERDKINVNWDNVDDAGHVVANKETALKPWTPERFFVNAADRLLRTNTAIWRADNPAMFAATFGVTNAFSITNIPVLVSTPVTLPDGTRRTNNWLGYTPAVHRLLQVVANIYDATTTNAPSALNASYPYFPSVFRPIFRRLPETDGVLRVVITGYREVTDTTIPMVAPSIVDPLDSTAVRTYIPLLGASAPAVEPMLAGIPLVIGAKKGFPNFNKFALENAIQVTRKLRFARTFGVGVTQTNQLFSVSVSSTNAIQAWNSYASTYPRNLQLSSATEITMILTNENGPVLGPNNLPLTATFATNTTMVVNPNSWQAFRQDALAASSASFKVPIQAGATFLANSAYVQSGATGGRFVREENAGLDPANVFRVPHLGLQVRARVRFVMLDTTANRIIDYVNLDSGYSSVDLMGVAMGDASCDRDLTRPINGGDLWCTNRLGDSVLDQSPTYGILNQIRVSLNNPPVGDYIWRDYNSSSGDKDAGVASFTQWMFAGPNARTAPSFEAPFNPTRRMYQYFRWEANDPLVHYTVPDLTDLLGDSRTVELDVRDNSPLTQMTGANPISKHYRPWGGNPANPGETSVPSQYNPAVKDPLVTRSDDWDFPTNKFASIGVLGRVHRGSPWQTVYLKAGEPNTNTWTKWSGQAFIPDAMRTRPDADRLLFDIFTAAPNQNATRGQLSVNQENLAAWSAVLSGVPVVTNAITGGWRLIQPASLSPELGVIVDGINATRSTNGPAGGPKFQNRVFAHAGDVLATPQLTDASPFLPTTDMKQAKAMGLTDSVYERIPQQILSLVTLDSAPRFIVYSYGQSLRPAPQSLVGGITTNYQVTAEAATRTVFRIEPGTNNVPRVVVEQFNSLPPD